MDVWAYAHLIYTRYILHTYIYTYLFIHLYICGITNNYLSFQAMGNLLKVEGKSNLCSNFSQWTSFHTDLFQDAKMWGLGSILSLMEVSFLPQSIWKRQMFPIVWVERELLHFLRNIIARKWTKLQCRLCMCACASFSTSQISAV